MRRSAVSIALTTLVVAVTLVVADPALAQDASAPTGPAKLAELIREWALYLILAAAVVVGTLFWSRGETPRAVGTLCFALLLAALAMMSTSQFKTLAKPVLNALVG